MDFGNRTARRAMCRSIRDGVEAVAGGWGDVVRAEVRRRRGCDNARRGRRAECSRGGVPLARLLQPPALGRHGCRLLRCDGGEKVDQWI